MDIRINDVIRDSIVDGPGLRLTVFTQGCPHLCPGCHNPVTHDPSGGRIADTDEIIALMDGDPLCGGLTLSGGEPFAQPLPCIELAKAAHAGKRNVWAYTGYTLEALRAMHDVAVDELLANIDVLVDGPFILAERSLELLFRGSKNQRLIDMNASGKCSVVLWERPLYI